MKKLNTLIAILFLICNLATTNCLAQKNKVVILDSIQAKKGLIFYAKCEMKAKELEVTKEILQLNHSVIDKQNTIITLENEKKYVLQKSIIARDTILKNQNIIITNQKKSIRTEKAKKTFWQITSASLTAIIVKLLFF